MDEKGFLAIPAHSTVSTLSVLQTTRCTCQDRVEESLKWVETVSVHLELLIKGIDLLTPLLRMGSPDITPKYSITDVFRRITTIYHGLCYLFLVTTISSIVTTFYL